jgi:hypothetical protein
LREPAAGRLLDVKKLEVQIVAHVGATDERCLAADQKKRSNTDEDAVPQDGSQM